MSLFQEQETSALLKLLAWGNSKNLLGTFKGEPSSASFKLDPPPIEHIVLTNMNC